MNKRIKELIDKAYIEVPHERDWDAMSSVFDKEKFAELIIGECVKVCLSQRDPTSLNYKPSEQFAEEIKNHFGVK